MKIITPYKGITLEFDEARHRFTRIIGGISTSVISVTGVTSVIDKSAQLISWAVRLFKEHLMGITGRNIVAEDIELGAQQHRIRKEKAATDGTIAHEYAEHFALGLKPEIPTSEGARNGVLAFLKWIDTEGMKLQNPEQLVYSKKWDYAGIADAEATKKGKLYLIDYKTSKGIYNEMRFQVSAYLSALQEMKKGKYEGYFILKFGKEDGNFETLYVSAKEAKKDFQAFLGALAIRRRENELPKWNAK